VKQPDSSISSDRVRAVLAEYQAIRDEIQRRSRDQMTCITTGTLSAGIFAGAFATGGYVLLLIIPVVVYLAKSVPKTTFPPVDLGLIVVDSVLIAIVGLGFYVVPKRQLQD